MFHDVNLVAGIRADTKFEMYGARGESGKIIPIIRDVNCKQRVVFTLTSNQKEVLTSQEHIR